VQQFAGGRTAADDWLRGGVLSVADPSVALREVSSTVRLTKAGSFSVFAALAFPRPPTLVSASVDVDDERTLLRRRLLLRRLVAAGGADDCDASDTSPKSSESPPPLPHKVALLRLSLSMGLADLALFRSMDKPTRLRYATGLRRLALSSV
jgi:hypothetical protein